MIRLEEITIIDAPIDRCFDLSRSVEVHLVANVHSGEQALAVGGVASGLVDLSQEVTWRAKHFGVWQNLTSKTTSMKPPYFFQVTMIQGIFRSMQADHLFRTLPSGATEMKDILSVAAPLPFSAPWLKPCSCGATCLLCCESATKSSRTLQNPPSGSSTCHLQPSDKRDRRDENHHSGRYRPGGAHPCPPLSPNGT